MLTLLHCTVKRHTLTLLKSKFNYFADIERRGYLYSLRIKITRDNLRQIQHWLSGSFINEKAKGFALCTTIAWLTRNAGY